MIDDEVLFDLLMMFSNLGIQINDPKFAKMFLDAQMVKIQKEMQDALHDALLGVSIGDRDEGIFNRAFKGLRDQIEKETKRP